MDVCVFLVVLFLSVSGQRWPSKPVSAENAGYAIMEIPEETITYSADERESLMFRCSAFNAQGMSWMPYKYVSEEIFWSGMETPGK